MPAFKPAYLIFGDDHGRIGERRSRLRAMAEHESGTGGVELLEAEACTSDRVAGALCAMTFSMGRRFVIADGVERWKDADVKTVAAALEGADGDGVTVAFFGRDEGRRVTPPSLGKLVEKVGGVVAQEKTLARKELPRWLRERASELGLELDSSGARALVGQVGERQQRLLRELEKLALEHGDGATIGVEEVIEACASSSERKAWTFGDALVAGDAKAALRALLELEGQGERIGGLLYTVVRRLRDAEAVAAALAEGRPAGDIKRTLRMPSFAADQLIRDVRDREPGIYRRALERMADLELELRGGGQRAASEGTLALRAVLATAA